MRHSTIYSYCLDLPQLLHVSALLPRHLQGADIKISLKYTAIKCVTVSVYMLWYQHL